LEVLLKHPEGIRARDAIAAVAARLTLSDYEKADYPKHPGVRRFDKLVRFLSIGPVKAGWIVKDKGIWRVTDAGEKALKTFKEPAGLFLESRRLYRAWAKEQPTETDLVDVDSNDTDTETEAGSETATLEEAEETAWAEIRDYLANMNPFDFQQLVAGLLKGMGYHVGWVAPPGPDKGTDIIAHSDPLGIEGPRLKVQVKRTPNSRITAENLRAFMSTLGESDVGLFVAAGGFTKDAEKEARGQEKRRITLLDLEGLFDLWVEHYKAIPEEERSLLRLRFVPYLAPDV
jgi:restriction system protein